jgi:hypothetical protein
MKKCSVQSNGRIQSAQHWENISQNRCQSCEEFHYKFILNFRSYRIIVSSIQSKNEQLVKGSMLGNNQIELNLPWLNVWDTVSSHKRFRNLTYSSHLKIERLFCQWALFQKMNYKWVFFTLFWLTTVFIYFFLPRTFKDIGQHVLMQNDGRLYPRQCHQNGKQIDSDH